MAALFNVLRSARRWNTKAGDFSPVVNRYCICEVESRARWNERIQVCQRSAWVPQERMLATGSGSVQSSNVSEAPTICPCEFTK
jgi:hypothetical protein